MEDAKWPTDSQKEEDDLNTSATVPFRNTLIATLDSSCSQRPQTAPQHSPPQAKTIAYGFNSISETTTLMPKTMFISAVILDGVQLP